MKIGVCGTGKMGAAIAQRLMSCSHKITVWNRDPAKTQPLASLGANVAASPAALCQACDVIITMVLDDCALDAVYRGAAGILSADLSGRLVTDMSTVLPATEEAIAAEVKEKGAAFVECPVGGTVGPAREGKLFGLMGGGEADVARAASSRAIVSAHRACRRARFRCAPQACDQPAAIGLLAVAWRSPCALQAAWPAARTIGRYHG